MYLDHTATPTQNAPRMGGDQVARTKLISFQTVLRPFCRLLIRSGKAFGHHIPQAFKQLKISTASRLRLYL